MKTLTILTMAGLLALAGPALAADSSPDAVPSAKQQCRTERSEMGHAAFAQLYGTNKNRRNAFGKCRSARAHETKQAKQDARSNASQDCKAERQADPAAFTEKYGTGRHGANAHGKCVSQKAKTEAAETVDEQVDTDVNAAQACKAERKADRDAFAETYGTNHNKRNAFGTCVSRTVRDEES